MQEEHGLVVLNHAAFPEPCDDQPAPAGHVCTNCQATSSPLWRHGPKGPKTLCNACGIRFKRKTLDFDPSLQQETPVPNQDDKPRPAEQAKPTLKSPASAHAPVKKRPAPALKSPTASAKKRPAPPIKDASLPSKKTAVENPTLDKDKVPAKIDKFAPELKKLPSVQRNPTAENHSPVAENTVVSRDAQVNGKHANGKLTVEKAAVGKPAVQKPAVTATNPLPSPTSKRIPVPNKKYLNEPHPTPMSSKKRVPTSKKKPVTQVPKQQHHKKPIAQAPKQLQYCSNCNTKKTPMWRNGPDGRRTLCNACGVRYQRGKLDLQKKTQASPVSPNKAEFASPTAPPGTKKDAVTSGRAPPPSTSRQKDSTRLTKSSKVGPPPRQKSAKADSENQDAAVSSEALPLSTSVADKDSPVGVIEMSDGGTDDTCNTVSRPDSDVHANDLQTREGTEKTVAIQAMYENQIKQTRMPLGSRLYALLFSLTFMFQIPDDCVISYMNEQNEIVTMSREGDEIEFYQMIRKFKLDAVPVLITKTKS